jgi:elongation factor Ts
MDFTAKDVQALRELTGAGMMDCKKALTACGGSQEKAIEFLREKGLAAMAKKSGRITAEGACFAVVCPRCGAGSIIEVNTETDFAAKSDKFREFIEKMADIAGSKDFAGVAELMAAEYSAGESVEAALREHIYKIGENITIRRFARFAEPVNAAYVHMGGKIAVLVGLDVAEAIRSNPAVAELGRDIAMQIAAMRPLWVGEADADATVLEKERAIYKAQVEQDESYKNKPPQVLEKIAEGRLRKFLEEVCLLKQAYVKDSSLTVGAYITQKAKELGGSIAVREFLRYETGEGLAKKEDDFASEVARMTGK